MFRCLGTGKTHKLPRNNNDKKRIDIRILHNAGREWSLYYPYRDKLSRTR